MMFSYISSHKSGCTSVFLCEDGRLITCGSDGKVLIWNSITDDNPEEHIVSEKINSVVQWKNCFITATEYTTVQMHSIEDGLPEGILTRFTAEVNHLTVNKEKTRLAAGASDFIVKLVILPTDATSSEQKEFPFSGHNGPVLSVALDPLDIYMASSSCDGTVNIWSVDSPSMDSARTPIKSFKILAKFNDASLAESRSPVSWDPLEGKLLAIATEKEIRLVERSSWEVLRFLTSHLISQPILDLAFSIDGVYLAAGSKDGWLIVWKVSDGDIVSKFKHPKCHSICSLKWHPIKETTIVFGDLNGYIGVVSLVLKPSAHQEPKIFSADDALTAEDIAALMGDEEDEDRLVSSAGQQQLQAQMESTVDDNIDDENDDANSVDISKLKASFMVDSDVSFDADKRDEEKTLRKSSTIASVKLPAPHKPFQPGGAPIGLSPRIMLWNRIGLVIQYDNEDDESVEVEFHDTTFHHQIHINNAMNYTLADLNEYALLLCSRCDWDDMDEAEESEAKSQLYVQPLSVINQEWRMSMPVGESICSCCVIGEGHVAVLTDAALLRVFTLLTGVQVGLISLPGSPISICGYGHSVMVICQQGMVGPLLHYAIIDLSKKNKSIRESNWSALPLSKSSSLLLWCGFSDYGTPFTADSAGVVRCRTLQWGSPVWVPVQQLKQLVKEKSDSYFVVGAMESAGKLQALYCKANDYPHSLPRPTVDLIDLRLPTCCNENDKEGLEEEYLRVKLTMDRHLPKETDQDILQSIEEEANRLDNKQKAVLLKMFALALKLDQEGRCMEIADLMPDASAIQLAIRYAAKLRRNQLCQRLGELALKKEQEALLDQEEEEEECSEDELPNKISKRLSPRKKSQRTSESQSESSETQLIEREDASESEQEREEILGHESEEDDDFAKTQQVKSSKQPLLFSALQKNPFRKADDSASFSSTQDKSDVVTGSQVFDNLSRHSLSLKNASQSSAPKLPTEKQSRNSGKKQATLFGDHTIENIPPKSKKANKSTTKMKDSKKAKFNEWFEYHRSELDEEYPEKSVEEILNIGKERYELEVKGAKSISNISEQSKKRKGDNITAMSDAKRASLCAGTKSKLSSFSIS